MVEDDRNSIRVDLGSAVPPLQVGNEVSLGGITAAGDLRPQLLGADVKVLDPGVQLPPGQPLSAEGIRSGALDYRWVAVRGVQRGRTVNRAGRVVIDVETPAGSVHATSFVEAQDNAPNWLGRRLRFNGVLHIAREANGAGLRTEVWVREWQRVELDEPTGNDAPGNLDKGLPLLRTVAEIRRLAPGEPRKGYPVLLHGIVTEPSRVASNIFLQDATGAIYARRLPKGVAPHPGDRVELEGHTVRGNFITDIEIERMTVAGHGPMPAPAKGSLNDVLEGRHLAEWVAIEGAVQSVEPGTGNEGVRSLTSVSLELLADGVRIPVSLRYPSAGLPLNLVAARVRALGVCASQYNQHRQFLGIRLEVPGPEFITILERPPTTPPPFRQVAQLLRILPGQAPDGRVSVRGVVTFPHVSELGGFYLQDETGGAFVRAIAGETVTAGDEVEVEGFPRLGRFVPVVEATGYRKTGLTKAVAPIAVVAEEALRGDYASQLIRIRGSLSTPCRGSAA